MAEKLKQIMKTFSLKHISLLIGISAVLFSCNTTRHFQQDEINTQGLFGTEQTDSVTMADQAWQELFSDPYLKDLIAEGLNNNPDLQIATQRVLEAEAYLKQSKASLLPGISATAADNYTRNSESIYPDGPRDVNTYQLGLEASWEVDIWGKLRSSKRAAYADLLATDAGKKAVQTLLISNIAMAYYNLTSLDAKLAITKQTVENNIDLVETMKVLKASGQVTGAAIVQSEAARYAAEVTIPDWEQQIRETENALSMMLGRVPGAIQRSELSEQQIGALLKTGVPSQLLENRPDIKQAELELAAAKLDVKSARARFYPSLGISAGIGYRAFDPSYLVKPESLLYSIAGDLAAPLINRNAIKAAYSSANAKQLQAVYNYERTILNAYIEVANQLAKIDNMEKAYDLKSKEVKALTESIDISNDLFSSARADYMEVLLTQRDALESRFELIETKMQQMSAMVNIYRALGGGWN